MFCLTPGVLQNPVCVTHNRTVLMSGCLGLFQCGANVVLAEVYYFYWISAGKKKKAVYAGERIMVYTNCFPPSVNRCSMKMETYQFVAKANDCKIFWATLSIIRGSSGQFTSQKASLAFHSLAFLTPITLESQFSLCPIYLLQKSYFSFHYTTKCQARLLLFSPLFFHLPSIRDHEWSIFPRTIRNFSICSLPEIEEKYKYLALRWFYLYENRNWF